MDVVDKVGSEPTGGKDVVASLIKRLAHRNANVQLYTLEVCPILEHNGKLRSRARLSPLANILTACQCTQPELRIESQP